MKALLPVSAPVLVTAALILAACAHNPNRAEKIDTKMDKAQSVSGNEKLGVKDGNLVVQKKVLMAEQLRDLQDDVYELEDHVYGNRKYGSKGLYGVLRDCRAELSDKKNGGDGHLMWTEPIDRVTDKEDDFKVGIDEHDNIVGVSDEYLKDRITRFKTYEQILEKREDEYEEKIEICKTQLKSQKYDMQQKTKGVTEN